MSNWTLMDHLTDYLARPRWGEQKEPNFYPSEATALYENKHGETKVAGKCRRAAFFRMVKDWVDFDPSTWQHMKPLADELVRREIPTDKYMRWIWQAGTMYETHVKDMCKSAGVYIADEVPIFIKDPRVSGRIDIVVIDPDTGELAAVEVKSIYGHNTTGILGKTGSSRTPAVPGEPRDSHLMQLGLYQWRYCDPLPQFGDAKLVYGARDTGAYGEFRVRISEDPDTNILSIQYKQVLPVVGEWITSPITINSIINDGYQYVQKHLDSATVPDRDYDLQYDETTIAKLYWRNELSKADTEKFEKLLVLTLRERVDDGEVLSSEEQALWDKYDGSRIKKDQKPIEKGDWQCRFCQWRDTCYDQHGTPRTV